MIPLQNVIIATICLLRGCTDLPMRPPSPTGVKQGFSWDTIFVPDGADQPFSMMKTEEKNQLSHRGKVVRQWANWLGKNQDELWERQQGRRAIGHQGLSFREVPERDGSDELSEPKTQGDGQTKTD